MASRLHAYALLATFVIAACSSREDVLVPSPAEGAKSVVVAVKNDNAITVYGGPIVRYALPLDIGSGSVVFVAFLDVDLEAIDVRVDRPAGRLALLETTRTGGRLLAPILGGFVRTIGESPDWAPVESPPEAFADVRLALVRTECRAVQTHPLTTGSATCSDVPVASPQAVNPPTPPASPMFDCAPGERLDRPGSPSVCRGYDPGVVPCGAAEIHSFAAGTCESITSRSCDDWPTNDTNAVYVRAGAVGGSGTQAAPFSAIAEAAAVAVGRTIVLSRGQYVATPRELGTNEVLGACVSQVVVDVVDVDVAGAAGAIRGVTLRVPTLKIDGGSFDVADAIIELSNGGITIDGAAATMTRVRIEGSNSSALDLIDVGANAALTMTGVTVLDAPGTVLAATMNGRAALDGVVFRSAARGARVEGTATFEVDRWVVEDVTESALDVASTTPVVASRTAFIDVGAPAVFVDERAELEATQISWNRALDVGLDVHGRATLDVATFAAMQQSVTSTISPRAIVVHDGAAVLATALYVHSSFSRIDVDGGMFTAADVVVEGPKEPATEGNVIRVRGGGVLQMQRVHVEGTTGAAFWVTTGASARIDDLTAIHLKPAAADWPGYALLAETDAQVFIRKASIADVSGRAFHVRTSNVELEDLTLSEVHAAPGMTFQNAIDVDGSTIAIARAEIKDVSIRPIILHDTTSNLEDLQIRFARGLSALTIYDTEQTPVHHATITRLRAIGEPNGPRVVPYNTSIGLSLNDVVLHMTDVRVEGAVTESVRLNTPEDVKATIDRLEIVDGRGIGLVVYHGVETHLSDLRISRTHAALGGGESTALIVPTSSVDVQRFTIEATEGAAIRIEEVFRNGTGLVMKTGRIDDATVGISVPALDLEFISFDDVVMTNITGRDVDTFGP